jgi:hypothetical protein
MNLDELKQQLYEKIKQTQKPETPLERKDLLKYSDLKVNQNFKRPQQGRIPHVPSDSEYLSIIQENLLEAVESLRFSHHCLENTGLSKRYSALFTAACDAFNATSAAIEHCDDEPDQ